MASIPAFNNSKDPLDLPGSCNEFNTFVVPTREVASLFGLTFSPVEQLLVSYIIPMVAVFGILCNMAFIFVLIRVQNMRTLVNFYLCNLAIADMCALANTLGIGIWTAYYSHVNNTMPFTSSLGCSMFFGEGYTFLFGSMIFVTLMTIERYLAICYPMYHRTINSKGRCLKLVLASWIIAALLALSVIPTISKVSAVCFLWPHHDAFFNDFPMVVTFCVPPQYAIFYRNIYFLLQPIPFGVAMLSSIFCYSRIIIQLSRRTVTKSTEDQTNTSSRIMKTRNEIARMLVVNGIVFFLLSFPAQLPGIFASIIRLSGNVWLDPGTLKQIGWIGRCLLYMNSCVNPIIYNIMSPRYREAFRQAFGCPAMSRTMSKNRQLQDVTSSTGTSSSIVLRDQRK